MSRLLALVLLAGVGCFGPGSGSAAPTVGPRPCGSCGEAHGQRIGEYELSRCMVATNAAVVDALQGIEHTLRLMQNQQAKEVSE